MYKQWTGLLERWNSGMVDWIFLFGFLIIYDLYTNPLMHNSALRLVWLPILESKLAYVDMFVTLAGLLKCGISVCFGM